MWGAGEGSKRFRKKWLWLGMWWKMFVLLRSYTRLLEGKININTVRVDAGTT